MNKYIFLDRDGVLNVDKRYVHKIEDLEILPGVIEGLKGLSDLGYKFIVVTNQAGIARGYYGEEHARLFNEELARRLEEHGIEIEKFYLCPHHPEFTGDCECRKPKPTLALQAASEFGFEIKDSIFIGDKDSDIEFGKNCGGRTILVTNGQYQNEMVADFQVNNLEEVCGILKNI